MKTIVIDFETYYDNEYSLRKMDPCSYILDPRFEVIGCAVKDGDEPAVWMTPEEFDLYICGLPEKVAVISHNALFDMSILSWRFTYVPHLMIDTLGMARAWLGHKLKSLSLANVALHYGIGAKGDTVHKVAGMSLAAIKAAGFYQDYASYSCNDAELCHTIYRKMIEEGYPAQEFAVMDTVLRCAVKPKFVLDPTLLAEHLHNIMTMKQDLLARCGLTSRDDLMSNDKFAAALEALGVTPPTKISLTTGKETHAFSKTDPGFLELEEHPDPQVGALVSARLGVKSTIEETRTQRLMKIASLTWPGNGSGLMPVPLRYSGAHTHRLSGEWKMNLQNLPSRGNNKIRSAIKAPPGHIVLTCDASQIEARIAAWFAGQNSMVDAFANGDDIYSQFASTVFGYPVDKKNNKVERFIGKTCLAEGTLLLTNQGLVPIELITPSHRLWDGEEWVCHSGVVENGLKKTLKLSGVWLTPDHLVLCGTQWREAQSVQADENFHSLALATGAENLPSQVTSRVPSMVSRHSSSSATAGVLNSLLTGITSKTSAALAALNAVTKLDMPSAIGNTRMPSLTTGTVPGCSTGYLPPSHAATTKNVVCSSITAGVESEYMPRGEKTVHRSFAMSRHFKDGIDRIMKWIASTSTAGTSRVTFGSLADLTTSATSARSQTLKPASANLSRVCQVYDVANAGPRNRFTIMTADGPMIVHNCILGLQYGLGWQKFQKAVALQSKAQVGQEIKLDDADAARIVTLYRNTYSAIPAMWNTLSGIIARMTSSGFCQLLHPVTFEHEKVKLPSGLYLHYHKLNNKSGQWWFEHGGKPKYIYGGKMLENITQALARIVVMNAAVRIRRRFATLSPHLWLNLQVHDELVYVVPAELAADAEKIVMEEMRRRPEWGQDIPLDAESGIGPSYGDAK